MRYQVTWLPLALEDLAKIWMDSTNRDQVTTASAKIDSELASHPFDVGESRDDDDRIAFESPLKLKFRIVEADKRVLVMSVGVYG